MNESKITVRYAKSFFDLAIEKGVIDLVMKDISLLNEFCSTSGDFIWLLNDKTIRSSQKLHYFSNIFSNVLNELTFSFLKLLVDNKRETYLPLILADINQNYQQHSGVIQASLTVASTLSEDLLNKIRALAEAHIQQKVDLTTHIKPELIGGFILNLDNQQLDTSVASQISRLKREFNSITKH